LHATNALAEADRLMTVCNSCRYCEGLCAVFPAMEMRRTFTDSDLNYIAHLCHGCGACYYDCQFAPPHEFDVNVPKTLAKVRADSYQTYAWPRALAGLFERNGLAIGIITSLSVAIFMLGFAAANDLSVLWSIHTGPAAFYRLMSHHAMILLFGAAFTYAIVAIAVSVRTCWRDFKQPVEAHALWQAMMDAGRLRYLDGGGAGCMNADERPIDRRKLYHHMTFYGFLLCAAATTVATIYHYFLAREAPYPWYDPPVLLGTVGGIGLVIGPAGLLAANLQRDPSLQDEVCFGMGAAFLIMLFLTSLTGIGLFMLRETMAMGVLLALHLGMVFGLFITMPYGKFVHGIYRFIALIRYAKERRSLSTMYDSDRREDRWL
jgi:citrate/tricarballylate utilization protein